MPTRREFLAAGAGIPLLQPAPSSLWAADAGDVRVAPGPWTSLPVPAAGVRLESLRLLLPDGIHLHALLYLPDDLPRRGKIPGVLNTTPYRNMPRSDSYFARAGYAAIYVDVRGTGASEGIPLDEYSPSEHEDTARVIDWLSKQPWSNGNVGMFGISYSAFNSVWVAAAIRPKALKAIFALAGTDNRYTDDIHYPGGAMLMIDNSWALGMVTSNVMPGAPEYDLKGRAALERWETTPWLQGFLHHQLDSPYWRHGSLAPDYSRLETPTFLGGGYLDIYQNFVPRIMKSSPAVTKGVLGPWHHSMQVPGPALDWNQMRVRWFDHWLKGHDTGFLDEPRVSFYMPRWRRQSFRFTDDVPGDFRHLDSWPETVFAPKERLYLRPVPERPPAEAIALDPAPAEGGNLSDVAGPPSALLLRYFPATGGFGQSHGPTTGEGYYGLDHRDEDVWGLTFDTPLLRRSLEILGFVKARLFVSATAPVANWIVKLEDVSPDGSSYLITRGHLNGTHRRSHTAPEKLVPGEVYEIEVELFCTAYEFEPDHRIRVVITNADFPVIWPSPYPMITTLYTGGDRPSHVELPALPALAYREATLPPLPSSSEPYVDRVDAYERSRDVASGGGAAFVKLGDDEIRCRVNENDPAIASLEIHGARVETQGERTLETRADGTLRSTVDSFVMDIECTLLENEKPVRSGRWKDEVRRELV
jgi:putative CocE/NonD family hydrolase